MSQQMSCGFAFQNDKVVLIRKNRPEHMAGSLCGVGGKQEIGESIFQCMAREFKEETGVDTEPHDWIHFADLKVYEAPHQVYFLSQIHFFRIDLPEHPLPQTMTDELVVRVDAHNLPHDVFPNLQWLVPMALQPRTFASITEYLR